MDAVLAGAQGRKEEESKLGEIVESELSECREMKKEFKEKQEANSGRIFDLIRELTLKARKEVEEEKAVREQTHDEILSYVEETCSSLGQEISS